MPRAPRGKRTSHSDGSTTISGKRGNGQGSVFFEKSRGRWVGSWVDVDGRRRKTTGKTREQVEVKLGELATALPEGPPLADALGLWLDGHARTSGLRPSSLGDYRTRIKRISGTPVSTIGVSEIELKDLKAWQADALASYSVKTVRGDLSVIKGALSWAIEHGHREHNPAREITFPRQAKQQRRALTPEETQALLAESAEHPLGVVASLLFLNGIRISEALGLAWEDINLEARTFTVSRAYVGVAGEKTRLAEPKTDGAKGEHRLPEFTAGQLTGLDRGDWPAVEYDGESINPVFRNGVGSIVNRQRISKLLKTWAKDAQIPNPQEVGTHTGRRTFVTALDASGVSVPDIADQVGHSDRATTERYVHRDRQRDNAVADLAVRLLAPDSKR